MITPDMVRDQVTKLLPSVAVRAAPSGRTWVNMQTILWADTPPTRTLATFPLLGRTIAVTITLNHVTWNFGDHTTATTTAPGKAYDPTGDPCATPTCPDYYGHVYRTTGTLTLTATTTWTATFTLDGTDPTPIPGTVTGPAATTPLTVQQAQAILVPDR